MKYEGELAAGKVLDVYNKMVADVELREGSTVAAFCGAVEIAEICQPGMQVLLLKSSDDRRIIRYNILFVKTLEGWVFADPKYNRALFKEAFVHKVMEDFREYKNCRPLKSEDLSGVDFELSKENGEKAFVFVTSIYNKKDGMAIFPQKMNFFEIKMLDAMRKLISEGKKAYIVMIAPREDCIQAKFVWDVDTAAAAAMYDAKQAGVKFLCYGCKIEENSISLATNMEIVY